MITKLTGKAALLTIMLFSVILINAGTVENKDVPEKGEYVFPMEKVWQVNMAGEIPFGNLVTIAPSDSGRVYCRDLKNKEFYMFTKDGKFAGKFGTRGEGPGEIKNPGWADITVLGKDILVEDVDKILYFSEDGTFIESQLNNRATRRSVLFLSRDEFISAPANILDDPDGKYLYRGIIRVEEGMIIKARPTFGNGSIYVSIEDEDGEIYLCKYKTKLPR